MNPYIGEADFSQLRLGDGDNIQVTYQDDMVILDLPDINGLSESKRIEIIDGLNRLLLQENGYASHDTLSFSEKIGFILDRSRGDLILPSSVDVVTSTNKIVVSRSHYQVDGDITSIVTDAIPKNNRDFLYQAHLLAIKLYMKKWRNNVFGLVEKISIILGWLNRLQAYASIIGFSVFLIGLLTGKPSFMVLSFLPIIVTGVLSLIKRRL